MTATATPDTGRWTPARIASWAAVAVLGAIAWGILALARGESVNAVWLVVAALCSYAIAYRFYARFIANRVPRGRRHQGHPGRAARQRRRLPAHRPPGPVLLHAPRRQEPRADGPRGDRPHRRGGLAMTIPMVIILDATRVWWQTLSDRREPELAEAPYEESRLWAPLGLFPTAEDRARQAELRVGR